MTKTNRFICGTVRECVTEIVRMINWDNMEIPDFDFCENCDLEGITLEDVEEAVANEISLGSGWYGAKNVSHIFDGKGNSIALLFGYYGGEGYEVVEIGYDEKSETNMIIDLICDAITNSTRGELRPDYDTVFELVEKGA